MNSALSFNLRPKTVEDIIGQSHLIGKGKIINKIIETQFCPNIIFYGNPGIGKTTLAIVLAQTLNRKYLYFNASNDKKEKLTKFIESVEEENNPIIIIDEIHRMNQQIQDFILEYSELRKITFFSTTTENPYFKISPAIRSRSTIIQMIPVSYNELVSGLERIITQFNKEIKYDKFVYEYIARISNGDVRTGLNFLEILINLYKDTNITIDLLEEVFKNNLKINVASNSDELIQLKSALQKSIRGSDVDASLHYWARIMHYGDYETLMRRMVIIAYEDIGLANPAIVQRVAIACEQFRKVGMPEGRIILGHAIIEMALSEKSNSSYLALEQAIFDVEKGITPPIPSHIKDSHYKSASKLGDGIGYKYPHDFDNDWVDQQYLPAEIKNKVYFKPKENSLYEKKIVSVYNAFTSKKR